MNILDYIAEKIAAELTTAGRARIKSKSFALLPQKKKEVKKEESGLSKKEVTVKAKKESGSYPIQDKAHASNALARVHQFGNPTEISKVERAVKEKWPGVWKKYILRKQQKEASEKLFDLGVKLIKKSYELLD